MALNHRTADRVLVVSLPGKGTFEFRLRLPAEPHRTEQFSPWHLADRIALAAAPATSRRRTRYTIRYRVLKLCSVAVDARRHRYDARRGLCFGPCPSFA